MLVPVADLIGNPGASRNLHRALAVQDVGDAPWGRAEDMLRGEIELTLGLDAVIEGVWVHGDVAWTIEMECGRCLRDVALARSAEVGELFLDPSRVDDLDEDERADVEDGYAIVPDTSSIDIERMLHDLVMLDLPVAVRCERDDCEPPTLDGVAVLSEDEARAIQEEQPDPRWAALTQLNVEDD
ncbi:MAG: hypothetical protein ACI970_000494 [Myxococcota bacterium]